MIERFLKIIMDWKDSRNKDAPGVNGRAGHHHSSAQHQPMMILEQEETNNGVMAVSNGNPAVDRIYESQEQVIKASFGHQAV